MEVTLNNVLFLIFFVILMFGGIGRGILVDESRAVRHLENLGFSEVVITDKAWFAVGFRGCSEKDAAKFTAHAINPAGKIVAVGVCVGWPFKGATIRS
jgi:hypothetical protein